MKQVRKVSNLVAEELQSALKDKGIVLDESAFEEKVSEIVSGIYESVNDVDAEEICEGAKAAVNEDDKFYMATKECTVGGKNVAEGEYVEIEDTDDGKVATIYDMDGEIKESDIPVEDEEEFGDSLEELEDEEEEEEQFEGKDCKNCEEGEEVEEGSDVDDIDDPDDVDDIDDPDDVDDADDIDEAKTHIKGGKKVKFTKNELKKKKAIAMGKKKEGYKWDSDKKKFVKMTAQEKKRAKQWAKKMQKGAAAAHRAKSMKKARKIAAGSNSGTVSESFDIHSDTMTFTVEAGDVLVVEDDTLNVIREGNTIIKGIQVSEGFFDRCFEAKVLEAEEEPEEKPEDEKPEECGDATKTNEGKKCANCKEESDEETPKEEVEESATLTFKADCGYTLTKEGKELPMGNRVRARATLIHEGFNITSDMLDRAVNGEVVAL